jgi:hypothetical protein
LIARDESGADDGSCADFGCISRRPERHIVYGNTAKENNMTSTTERPEAATATVTAEPKPSRKVNVGKRARHAAPTKAGSRKKPSQVKKAHKRATKANASASAGSKSAKILDLLKRPGGATAKELIEIYWLAAAFGARVPVRHGRQEDWAGRRVRQK